RRRHLPPHLLTPLSPHLLSTWHLSAHWKKIPFLSCPVSPNTLVEVLAAFEVNVKPFSLADQVIVAGVSAYSPAKPFAASLTLTRRVTPPVQTTSNETVAGTEGPSLKALPRVK